MSSQGNDIPEGFKMTELGPLPEEWEAAPIADLAFVASGGSAPQGDHYFGGNNPFVRVQHVEQNADRISKWDLITNQAVHDYGLRLLPKGTIVFPKSGASIYLEKRAVLPIDAYIVSHLCALSPRTEIVDGLFLFHGLRHIRFAELKAEGYPTLNLSEIKVTRLPLPPLLEQKAIAHVLTTIQKAIEAQAKIIAAARELKKSLMHHLFTYGPVPVSEAEQVPLKETEIGPVPEHWEVKRLIEVAISNSDIVGGPFGSNLKVSDYQKSGIPIIRLQNIERNKFVNKDIKFISREKAEELKYHSFSAGDIVLAKLGDPIGKTCIVPDDLVEGIVVADVVRIRTDPALTYKDYIVYALNTNFCGEQFRSQKTGTTRPRVNVSNVRNLLIPVAPIDEQQDIARALLTVDEKIEAEEKRKVAFQALFKTMLHLLMTGKVRVKEPEATVA